MSSSSSEKPTTSQNSKKLSVNNEIIQNYLQHAKGRDIKRFMRLNSKSTSSDDSESIIGVEILSGKDDNFVRVLSDPIEEDEQPSSSKTKSEPRTPEKKKVIDEYVQVPDSITKNTKKLEWDSLGDVGYNKSSSTGNLSSLERSVLKELLSESPSEPNISSQRSGEIKSSSSLSFNQQMRRERWRQTLENLGKKYSSLSMTMDTPEFSDLPQSTPVLSTNTDKSVQTTFKRTDQKSKPVVETDSHGIQTSFDDMTSKRRDRPVQKVDRSAQPSFDRMAPRRSENKKVKEDHAVQTTFSRTSSETSKDASKKTAPKSEETQTTLSSQMGSVATPSSFEYYPGDSETSSSVRRSVRRNILGEKNTNPEASKSKPSSDSDKENEAVREPKRSKSEVELGIKLLCSLIDAKNLTGRQKKNLAKKIFDKIMKEQSGESTTTSQTSRSSAASAQSLIEASHRERSDDSRTSETMIGDDSISVLKISEETQTELVKVRHHPPPSSSSSHEEPVTMREWLHPLTQSEKDYDEKAKKKSSESLSAQSVERQRQLSWIESEINRLEGLKNLLQESSQRSRPTSSRSTSRSNPKPEVIYEESEDIVKEEGDYQSSTRKTAQVVIYDEPHADVTNVKYKTTKVEINQERRASSASSVRNHRSKLETPTSSSSAEGESVSAFANHLQKEFMEKYSKKKRTTSEHYSEPRGYGKPVLTRNPSYTSVASSSFCVSSEMSIPIVESSSTTTTTHQYDSNTGNSVEGVAVQTSYSIVKTQPIFGPRCKCICICGKQCRCSCPRPTLRVSGTAYHQTVQVKPQALAYVIRFTGTTDNEGKRLTKDCCTLRERLEAQYPDFCEKANKRQEILKKLHELRQERENRIREIAESSNMSSIAGKLEQLPPPAIKQVRVFPTKEAKGMTRKRYYKLPEVVAKQEREKLERKKKANRIITGVFNKKLQKMVHDGKLSLEYSRTVI